MKSDKKYAFLMINYDTPSFIKELHDKIKDEEVYQVDEEYGRETESHVTLVPCLDNSVDVNEIKKYLNDLDDYRIVLTDISKFECDDFDVLKCNVSNVILNETNKKIREDFETFTEHKDYKPHLTICYMKKGMADKYLKNSLDKLEVVKPKHFSFSWWDNDEMKKITFEK